MAARETIEERVEREEREHHTAWLHYRLHGNWLMPDECPVCIVEDEDE